MARDTVRGGHGYLRVEQTREAEDIRIGVREFKTLTCCHCNRVVVLNPERTRDRHHCYRCNHYVCDSPGCIDECNPILEAVELALHYSDSAEPFLLRGPRGEVLFDTRLRDRERIH